MELRVDGRTRALAGEALAGELLDATAADWDTEFLARAAGLGQPVSINSGTSVISGIFETIDETGCMIVTTADRKRIPIAAGDVYFGDIASAKATD